MSIEETLQTKDAGHNDVTARARFVEGCRSVFPFLVSVAPMALVGGALGVTNGLSVLGTLGLAMAANSGTAQFVAFSLIAQGASPATVFLTCLVLGLRMLIYATVLRKYLTGTPRGWKVVVGFGLIDAIFFVAIDRLRKGKLSSRVHWYFFGASCVMYTTWMVCTLVGALFGGLVPDPQEIGLDFPMTALFVAMLAVTVDSRKLGAIAAVSGIITLVCGWLPFNLGIVVALVAGIGTGGAWDAVARRRADRHPHDPENTPSHEVTSR